MEDVNKLLVFQFKRTNLDFTKFDMIIFFNCTLLRTYFLLNISRYGKSLETAKAKLDLKKFCFGKL